LDLPEDRSIHLQSHWSPFDIAAVSESQDDQEDESDKEALHPRSSPTVNKLYTTVAVRESLAATSTFGHRINTSTGVPRFCLPVTYCFPSKIQLQSNCRKIRLGLQVEGIRS